MKKIVIKLFKLYQCIPGSFHSGCTFIPSCSEYGIIAVQRFGVIRGLYLTFKRVIRCRPKNKLSIDLVEERRKL